MMCRLGSLHTLYLESSLLDARIDQREHPSFFFSYLLTVYQSRISLDPEVD